MRSGCAIPWCVLQLACAGSAGQPDRGTKRAREDEGSHERGEEEGEEADPFGLAEILGADVGAAGAYAAPAEEGEVGLAADGYGGEELVYDYVEDDEESGEEGEDAEAPDSSSGSYNPTPPSTSVSAQTASMRADPYDGVLYTREEFEDYYGGYDGDDMWEVAGARKGRDKGSLLQVHL